MLTPKVAKPGTKGAGPTNVSARSLLVAPSSGIGNQAMLRLSGIQAKLTVGESHDPLEHEADRAADQAMSQSRVAGPISAVATSRQSEEAS